MAINTTTTAELNKNWNEKHSFQHENFIAHIKQHNPFSDDDGSYFLINISAGQAVKEDIANVFLK